MEFVGFYLISVLGMFTHFLKKKIKGETPIRITRYFRSHFRSTLLALISTTIGFLALVQMGEIGFMASFGVGYTFDSMFNKWEKN